MSNKPEFGYPQVTPGTALEQCVYCGDNFAESTESNYNFGPVYDPNGNEYEYVGASEPGTKLLHRRCYLKHRGKDSKSLTAFE